MLDHIEVNLKLLEFKCRRPVEHLLAGEYRSVFRGRGLEFEDVRIYQQGDDVRSMDWKVTARTGKPHIKRFIEEREQFIYLLVDVSASMRHDAGGRKHATVTELCALLTLAAIKNQDRVGLILFSDRIEGVLTPSNGRRHALRLIDQLANIQPEGKGTDLKQALEYFRHISRKHSIVFLISDFLTELNYRELQALSSIQDLNLLQIREHGESEVSPTSALVRIQDAETDQQTVVAYPADPRAGKASQADLRQTLLRMGIHHMQIESGGDCVETLVDFFHRRQQRSHNNTGG